VYNHLQNEKDLWFHMTISKSSACRNFREKKINAKIHSFSSRRRQRKQLDPAVFIRLLQPVKNPHLKKYAQVKFLDHFKSPKFRGENLKKNV